MIIRKTNNLINISFFLLIYLEMNYKDFLMTIVSVVYLLKNMNDLFFEFYNSSFISFNQHFFIFKSNMLEQKLLEINYCILCNYFITN